MNTSIDPARPAQYPTRRKALALAGLGALAAGLAPRLAFGQGDEEVLTEALVLKDWPILGEVSMIASRMALACKYQDKFVQAHDALIGVSSKLTEPRIGELLAGAGIDVDRANRDLATNAKAIDAVIARNGDQAVAFGFKGTPSFIVGKFRVPGILTMAQFDQAIADARKAAANK